uniref:Bridge-like lipid transfer protein family member 1 N-terminal domain-containing protein n=1 Tax=Panagrolaimus superbus TaxID=310955 RepID=A0A914Z370_9BILA
MDLVSGEDPASAAAAQQRALRHQPPADKIDEWWDNFWRLSGMIKLDISSGRVICGNHLMPTSFATVFEDLKSRIFLSDASNKQDRFMLKAKTTMENVRVSLVKTTGYSGVVCEDPPRIIGDGFAILQSASIHFYYHQDLLGVNLTDVQSQNHDVPVWESIWRLDNNTVFSYGPWADKQRTVLWSFFFPSDYGTAEIVEYGWLMELILGDLTSKIHPGQLIEVVQFLESTILLIMNSDEKLEVPDRLDLCQHFENIRLYKAAIKIDTNKVHVCFCNAHAGSFCENVIVQIPLLKCKQLLHVPEKKLWLECGFAKIHEVSLDFRLPCPEAQLYVLEERKIFLTKHDKPQPRLYFLWEKGTKNCGCVGSTRFFAEKDKTGPQFIVTSTSDLAIPNIVASPGEQPGFFQSIIYPNTYGIQLSQTNILLSTTESSHTVNLAERKQSTTSTTSFHSVKSATSSPATSAYDYAAFLENYEIIFSISGMPQLNELDDVRMAMDKNDEKVDNEVFMK